MSRKRKDYTQLYAGPPARPGGGRRFAPQTACAAWLVMATSGGVLAVVSTYTYIYCYEFSTEQLSISRLSRYPRQARV